MNRPQTFCGLCGESGSVTVWHPETLSSLRREDETVRLVEAVVACTCNKGDRLVHKRRRSGQVVKGLERYGEQDWHVRRSIRRRDEAGFTSIFDPAADVTQFGSKALCSFVGTNSRQLFDQGAQ